MSTKVQNIQLEIVAHIDFLNQADVTVQKSK